jgi:hypothetical protein
MTADAKLEAFQELLTEVSGSIADIVQSMESHGQANDQTASALTDIAAALDAAAAGKPLEEIVKAIKGLKLEAPVVNVQVHPTAIENHNHIAAPVLQILERAQASGFKAQFTYDRHDRVESAILTPLPARSEKSLTV